MKMTREECTKKYGPIDFASKYWPNQNVWIKLFEVPEGWFPNWKVLNTAQTVRHIACNIDLAVPLRAALTEIRFYGLGDQLKTFDGAFALRFVRGRYTPSTHAYGLAIDINAGIEPLGTEATHFTPEFIDCWRKHGWKWGGDFIERKDNMHFSACSWE